MASLVVQVHDLNSEYATASPEHSSSTHSSSEYRAVTNVYSPKPKQRSCLCSPTTHEGSFRCRLHRSSSGYWGRKPMPTPTPTPTPTPPRTPPPTPTPSHNGVVRRTDQSAEAPSNIADGSCTCCLSSENPTSKRLFWDGVSSK